MVAPDHPALAVDRAEPVGVAVEGDAEIEALLAHQRLQILEIGLLGRIGMVVGEAAVDLGVENDARPAAASTSFSTPDRRRRCRVPADPEGAAVEALKQPLDVALDHVLVADRARALPSRRPRPSGRAPGFVAEEGAAAEHHLEAVIVGRIVAAGDHDAAVDVELGLGIIEHRRRPEPDPDDVGAARGQASDQRRLEPRRAFPPVAADRDAGAAAAPHQGAEARPTA